MAAKGGLGKWFGEKWVNIGASKKKGKYQPCGRPSSKKDGAYPKCVPVKKAAKMAESQKKSAVTRKRSVGNVGPKPTNVSTFTKRSSK